ncbi:hypothetical protein GGR54DRAFT_635677 [Hypoxylon sp. NC1633]|nr:hypothetical protein GGR54DRAFT_635677 [Hypoxylon sp. NC1633]
MSHLIPIALEIRSYVRKSEYIPEEQVCRRSHAVHHVFAARTGIHQLARRTRSKVSRTRTSKQITQHNYPAAHPPNNSEEDMADVLRDLDYLRYLGHLSDADSLGTLSGSYYSDMFFPKSTPGPRGFIKFTIRMVKEVDKLVKKRRGPQNAQPEEANSEEGAKDHGSAFSGDGQCTTSATEVAAEAMDLHGVADGHTDAAAGEDGFVIDDKEINISSKMRYGYNLLEVYISDGETEASNYFVASSDNALMKRTCRKCGRTFDNRSNCLKHVLANKCIPPKLSAKEERKARKSKDTGEKEQLPKPDRELPEGQTETTSKERNQVKEMSSELNEAETNSESTKPHEEQSGQNDTQNWVMEDPTIIHAVPRQGKNLPTTKRYTHMRVKRTQGYRFWCSACFATPFSCWL